MSARGEAHWDGVAGVWQRVSLEAPTGTTTDVASAVWWIQAGRSATPGPRLFADIRIPPRPHELLSLRQLQLQLQQGRGRGQGSPVAGDDACGVSLADVLRQRASAGVLECVPLDPSEPLPAVTATPPTPVVRCTWRCHLDYHPPSDDPDTGLAGFVDELTMIETGVYSDYREIWIRRDEGHEQVTMELIEERPPATAAHPERAAARPRRGVWVISGRYFAQVVDRYVREEGSVGHRIATTPSPSLGDLLARTWNLPEAQQRSAATLFVSCFGVIERDGAAEVWRVLKSTKPELEGTVLFASAGAGAGAPRRLERLARAGDGDSAESSVYPGGRLRETLPDGTIRLWGIHADTFQRDLFPAAGPTARSARL